MLEVFNSKIYYNNDDNQSNNTTSRSTSTSRMNCSNVMIDENPKVKYNKLKKELESLDRDLKELLTSTTKPDDASVWAMLQAETVRLRDRVDNINNHKGFQVYENLVLSSVQKIEEASKKISSPLPSPSSSSSSSSSSSTTTATRSLPSQSTVSSSISLSSLDQRIFTIETMLGHSSNVLESSSSLSSSAPGIDMTISGRGHAIPLIDTINKIDNKLKQLSSPSSSQESLVKKCEALKVELESVNSQISTTASSSPASNLFNAAKIIDDLYEKAQIIEGISPDLPKILHRLQNLEQLSLLSSSFNQRVDNMKSDIKSIDSLLKSNNDSIANMKISLSEQMTSLAEACKKLGK